MLLGFMHTRQSKYRLYLYKCTGTSWAFWWANCTELACKVFIQLRNICSDSNFLLNIVANCEWPKLIGQYTFLSFELVFYNSWSSWWSCSMNIKIVNFISEIEPWFMTVPIFCHNISTGLVDHETSNTSSLNSFQLLWHVQIQEKLQIFSFSRLEREGGHIHWHSVLLVSKSWFPTNLNQRMSQSTQLCFQLSLGHNTLWNMKNISIGKFWHLRNQHISPGKI